MAALGGENDIMPVFSQESNQGISNASNAVILGIVRGRGDGNNLVRFGDSLALTLHITLTCYKNRQPQCIIFWKVLSACLLWQQTPSHLIQTFRLLILVFFMIFSYHCKNIKIKTMMFSAMLVACGVSRHTTGKIRSILFGEGWPGPYQAVTVTREPREQNKGCAIEGYGVKKRPNAKTRHWEAVIYYEMHVTTQQHGQGAPSHANELSVASLIFKIFQGSLGLFKIA